MSSKNVYGKILNWHTFFTLEYFSGICINKCFFNSGKCYWWSFIILLNFEVRYYVWCVFHKKHLKKNNFNWILFLNSFYSILNIFFFLHSFSCFHFFKKDFASTITKLQNKKIKKPKLNKYILIFCKHVNVNSFNVIWKQSDR